MFLTWCAVSALCAALLIVFAAARPQHTALRLAWSLLLLLGQVLPFALLPIAWSRTRFVIPFLGPPIRIGTVPVWWALAAVVLAYVAACVDVVKARERRWLMAVPPLHAFVALRRLWQ